MATIRNWLILLLAAALAAAPLAQAVAAQTSTDCSVLHADLTAEGCCGDVAAGPECAMGGSACMAPASLGAEPRFRLDAVLRAQLAPSTSQARAPDTAPPKSSSA